MFEKPKVYMGSLISSWESNKRIKNISFSITDDCNLRCTYCYFKHKTNKNVMSFEVAQKAVDDILTESLYDEFEGVVWEFIGGEPTIEMELIDKISDYILYKMYTLNHKWLYCYRFMIGSNGLLYDSLPVQNYIKKHRNNLYVAITIDGTKEKHDLSRVKVDGSGSYDDVKRIIPLWKKQFGALSTKATFSHDDLPFLKDSIINLWNLGLKSIAANIVFEDVWQDGDVEIYKKQLYELADYIVDNDLWDTHSVRFFDPIVGTPYTDETMRRNVCGAGTMMAINTDGDYYPCVRFMPSASTQHAFGKLGSVNERINPDRLRAFVLLNTKNQSSEKCLSCDIAGGCGWCSGFNFDASSIGTIYERQTFICEMQKANVEVNKYIWRRYELSKHKISPYRYNKLTSISPYNKYMYILCDNGFSSFCQYPNTTAIVEKTMNTKTLYKAIEYCDKNNFVPVLCGCRELPSDYYAHQIITYDDYLLGRGAFHENYITQLLVNVEDVLQITSMKDFINLSNIIISYKSSQTNELLSAIAHLSAQETNISFNLCLREIDGDDKEYLFTYKTFLNDLWELILNRWSNGNYITVNVITSELFANTNRSCGAGKNTYAMSPDGKFYICPGFYRLFPSNNLGDIETGLVSTNSKHFDMENAPLCGDCKVRHCSRCVLSNKIGTGEYLIPTELQCVISHMEYEYTYKLSQLLNSQNIKIPIDYNKNLPSVDYYDPVKILKNNNYPNNGYNNYVSEL